MFGLHWGNVIVSLSDKLKMNSTDHQAASFAPGTCSVFVLRLLHEGPGTADSPMVIRLLAESLLTLFQVSLALPTLQDKAGLGATYLIFAGIGVVSLVSIYLTIPETKGKTLEEIEALWAEEDKGS